MGILSSALRMSRRNLSLPFFAFIAYTLAESVAYIAILRPLNSIQTIEEVSSTDWVFQLMPAVGLIGIIAKFCLWCWVLQTFIEREIVDCSPMTHMKRYWHLIKHQALTLFLTALITILLMLAAMIPMSFVFFSIFDNMEMDAFEKFVTFMLSPTGMSLNALIGIATMAPFIYAGTRFILRRNRLLVPVIFAGEHVGKIASLPQTVSRTLIRISHSYALWTTLAWIIPFQLTGLLTVLVFAADPVMQLVLNSLAFSGSVLVMAALFVGHLNAHYNVIVREAV